MHACSHRKHELLSAQHPDPPAQRVTVCAVLLSSVNPTLQLCAVQYLPSNCMPRNRTVTFSLTLHDLPSYRCPQKLRRPGLTTGPPAGCCRPQQTSCMPCNGAVRGHGCNCRVMYRPLLIIIKSDACRGRMQERPCSQVRMSLAGGLLAARARTPADVSKSAAGGHFRISPLDSSKSSTSSSKSAPSWAGAGQRPL